MDIIRNKEMVEIIEIRYDMVSKEREYIIRDKFGMIYSIRMGKRYCIMDGYNNKMGDKGGDKDMIIEYDEQIRNNEESVYLLRKMKIWVMGKWMVVYRGDEYFYI